MRFSLSTILALLLSLPATRSAHAEATPRPLTLAEAVELALRADPIVAEAHIQQDRSRLGLLRAQLDRVSVKVDGSIQELWAKSNILGPTPSVQASVCTLGRDINGNAGMYNLLLGSDVCSWVAGTSSTVTLESTDPSPSRGLGTSNFQANVSVPLFTGFRVSSNVNRAKRLGDLSDVSVQQSRKDVALSVARVYWQVRRFGLMQEAQQRSLEQLRVAEQVTQARVKAGLAPPIDMNRARVRILQQEAQVAEFIGQQREVAAQVGISLGLPATETIVLVDPPNVPETEPPPVAELLEEARKGRPELRTAKLQLQVQEQVIRIAKSAYYPQLGVFGLFQYGNNTTNVVVGNRSSASTANPFGSMAGNITLGASLSMNFFDTFNTYTSVKDAQLELSRLGQEQRRQTRIVEADVLTAHAKLLRLYSKRALLLQSLAMARDNLEIIKARYQNGEALITDVLDVQVSLVDTELQLADLTAQLQIAWIELDAALGHVVGERGAPKAGGGS